MSSLTIRYTPNQIATSRGIDVNKVLGWIDSGELKAVNYATKRGGLPRWKIAPEDLEAFEKLRESRPDPVPARQSRKKLKTPREYV